MRKGFTIRVDGVDQAVKDLAAHELRKRGALSMAVAKTLLQGEAHMKQMLSQPGRGRVYGRHRASAPGDPPAPDFGQYRASWRHRTNGLGGVKPGGDLYTEQERAPHLERGTRRMGARPHAGPVAEAMRDDFRRNSTEALR